MHPAEETAPQERLKSIYEWPKTVREIKDLMVFSGSLLFAVSAFSITMLHYIESASILQ